MLSGIPECLPSGYSVFQVQSLSSELFTDKVTGDIYKCNYNNKLYISSG